MKVVLEFNLPDEETEFRNAINGSIAIGILNEISNELRRLLKYEYPNCADLPKEVVAEMDKFRTFFYDALSDTELKNSVG